MPKVVTYTCLFKCVILLLIFFQLAINVSYPSVHAQSSDQYVFGTLQSDPVHAPSQVNGGIKLVELGLAWSQFEPQEGIYNQSYISEIKSQLANYESAGAEVVLGLGVQYPPDWIFLYPDSYYVNQYGDQYQPADNGKKIGNMVFNQTLRDKQAKYLDAVFTELGTHFYAVRLGGGWYGELNYPDHHYNDHQNTYWAYDNNALGLSNNLPETIPPIPNPQWKAGMSSVNHQEAREFMEWYLNSLKDYHDWQIQTAREYYSGKLAMLYPSWGIRPGQLELAIQNDLAGNTSAEVNGEIQRGFDFARFIGGITDPKVVVYTTWIDSTFGNDLSTNQADWTPVHYLSSLAKNHVPPLMMWGENTGRGSYEEMIFSFSQMKKFGLLGLVWAFEPDLYTDQYATVNEYEQLISETQLPTPTFTVLTCREDINRDGQVNLIDYSILVRNFLRLPIVDTHSDINQNGIVDLTDYSLLVRKFLLSC